ncbi:MAG: alpha/beta fold hydrolase [Aquabacterium sp.]
MSFIYALLFLLAAMLLAAHLYTRKIKGQVEAAMPPQGRFIDVPGARLHVVEKGAGPPLLLIHGLMGNLCNYTYGVVDRLSGRYRVIAVDRPGSGYSVRHDGTAADLPTQADAMAALIDALKLDRSPVIVGHSLGGALALCLAQRHPGKVAALALLAPLTQDPGEISPAFNGIRITQPWLQVLLGWTLAVPVSMRTKDKVLAVVFGPEAVPADFGTRGGGLLGVRPTHYVAGCRDLAAAGHGIGDQVAAYARMTLPVRVLYGRGDQILNPQVQGQGLVDALPGATLELIDGGHMIPITAPQACADFIARVADEAATPAARAA